jgi:phosphatidylserine decarboxylase
MITKQPVSLDLASTRVNELVQGSIQIKLGFVEPPQVSSLMTFEEVYFELAKRSRPRASIMSAPPVRRA